MSKQTNFQNVKTTILPIGVIEENDGQIEGLPANPRFIQDENFEKLKRSIEEDPEMLGYRELLVYPLGDKYIIVGGNMRYRAMTELGYKEAPCKILPKETPVDKLRAYTIKDNNGFGEWNWDLLINDGWDMAELDAWGMDMSGFDMTDNGGDLPKQDEDINQNPYSNVLDSPIYQPTGACPSISDILDTEKTDSLLSEINSSSIPEDIKQMLRICSYRHTKINFSLMAEYYAHAPKEVQELMEKNALVIIDYNSAIEQGYAILRKELMKIYNNNKTEDITDVDEE